jgi:MFS family permease
MIISSSAGAAGAPEASRAPRSAWYALAVLVLVTIFGFVDRQVLTILTEPVRHSLSLSDVQIGMLQGLGLTLFAALGSMPLAWLADRYDRRVVLACCVLVWSLATAACGLAADFNHLLLATIGIAVGEAGLAPIIYAMIPSMFPERQRVTANFIFYGATVIGASFGLALGGVVYSLVPAIANQLPPFLQGMEAWRLAFLAVALPGPVFMLLVLSTRSRRTAKPVAESGAQAQVRGTDLLVYLRQNVRGVGAVCGSVAAMTIAFTPVMAWLPPALTRVYGVAPGEVGVRIGAILGIAGIGGIALATISSRIWRPRMGDMLAVKAGQLLSLAAAVPTALLYFADEPLLIYTVLFLISLAIICYSALLPGLYQSIAPNQLLARVVALAGICSAVASAIGPVLAGFLSDRLSGHPNGILLAVSLVSVPCLLLNTVLLRWAQAPLAATMSRKTA